jgi:hypothetical protein
LQIVEAIRSPWLQMTLDTGNFLERRYEQMERKASSAVPIALVQAKTYYGGGPWYTLDLGYVSMAELLRRHGYRGWISLEFEGNEKPESGVPRSLALLRRHLSYPLDQSKLRRFCLCIGPPTPILRELKSLRSIRLKRCQAQEFSGPGPTPVDARRPRIRPCVTVA